MQAKHLSSSFSVPLLATALLLTVGLSVAQMSPQNATPQGASPQQAPSGGITIDPSAGPLQPSQEQPSAAPLPDAPQPAATPTPAPRPAQPTQPAVQAPLGAAAAEQIKTAGGGASRPAGNAIAPAKQRQYHSLVIKLGAAAAVAVAAGAVYGLSRATSSTPPHATTAAAR